MDEPVYSIPPDTIVHSELMVVQGAVPWTRPESVMQPIWAAGVDGRGCIGINLDTGWRKHVDLPEPLAARNFVGGAASDVTDRHGHGNHCIGSMVGRNGIGGAPAAMLKVGKVLGDSGSGSGTTAGLEWAAREEGDVVSCSWGSNGTYVDPRTTKALQAVEESGKWIVFAAGNAGYNGRNSVGSPAVSPHNLACASLNRDLTLSGFSSGGPAVDIAAGGGMILSAGLRNDRVMMSGTSMATPTAVGDLLLLRQVMKALGMSTYMDSRGLVKFLTSEEFLKDAGPVGRDPRYGDGIITTANILAWIKSKQPEFL